MKHASRALFPRVLAVLAAVTLAAAAGAGLGSGERAASPPAALALEFRPSLYLPLLSPPERPTAPVTFSHEGGVLDGPIALTLATTTAGATIYYTLDGSEPGPGKGRVYVEPLAVGRTSTLRAMARRPGRDPSPVTTRSYIFLDDVFNQPRQPSCPREADRPPCFPGHWGFYPPDSVPSGAADRPVPADYEMDPRVIAHVGPEAMRAALLSLPSLSLVADPEDLFDAQRGIYANPLGEGLAWERPVSAELFQPDGQAGFQVDGGLRIAGRWSRRPDATAKHSFSLRFKSQYGPKKLDYPLFPGSKVRRFNTLRLRANQADSFNYWPGKAQFIHDQWGRDTQRDMGWVSAPGIFVHLYLNGLYWGLYNVTEEPTADFAAEHLGGKAEDWDVLKEGHEIEDGESTAYEALLALAAEGPADPRRYDRIQAYLDLPQFADYHLLQIFGANWDWPQNNWRAARNRVTGEGFQYFAWDLEHMTQLDTYGVDGSIAATAGVDGLHGWLKDSPEYRILFADRVQRHLRGGGALTPAANWARYERLADSIEAAVPAESARWGDVIPGWSHFLQNRHGWCRYLAACGQSCQPTNAPACPQLPDRHWRPERDRLRDAFFPRRTAVVLEQLCGQGLFPRLAPPRLDPPAGAEAPAWLTMVPDLEGPLCADSRSDGRIYYTLDGSDPRQAWTGRPAPLARLYSGPLRLPKRARVMARAMVEGPEGPLWSAAVVGDYGLPRLAISELMYHPPDGEDHEFLELVNREPFEVDLAGITATGIDLTLPAGAVLGPFEHGVLVSKASAFRARYPGVKVLAEYGGRLSNSGERIILSAPGGEVLVDVTYDDEGFWPLAPDGRGWSLVLEDPAADPKDPESWRASARPGGSPGVADPRAPYQVVRVNEVLARASAPWEPAVELYNPGPGTAHVGGWGLTDDLDQPFRHRLSLGGSLAAGAYLVVYQGDLAFPLDPGGGELFLVGAGADGTPNGLMLGVAYGPAEDGRSFGRHRGSGGLAFPALAQPTFGVVEPASVADFRRGQGAANAPPWVGPVVINEIMYHPVDGAPEYLELYNSGPEPLRLGDGYDPRTAWRMALGVQITIPPSTVIAPGGYLLLTEAEPAQLRQAYDLAANVAVLGPWSGRLDNAGERIELVRPLELPDGRLVESLVDGIHYHDVPPWRIAADGQGPSLERLDPRRFGDGPANWEAFTSGGTPGRANTRGRRAWLPFTLGAR